jgi:hypothetical protein
MRKKGFDHVSLTSLLPSRPSFSFSHLLPSPPSLISISHADTNPPTPQRSPPRSTRVKAHGYTTGPNGRPGCHLAPRRGPPRALCTGTRRAWASSSAQHHPPVRVCRSRAVRVPATGPAAKLRGAGARHTVPGVVSDAWLMDGAVGARMASCSRAPYFFLQRASRQLTLPVQSIGEDGVREEAPLVHEQLMVRCEDPWGLSTRDAGVEMIANLLHNLIPTALIVHRRCDC